MTLVAPSMAEQALFDALPGWPMRPAIAWLMTEGRLVAQPEQVLDGVASRLIAAGAPLARLYVGIATLHPQIAAWSVGWSVKAGEAQHWARQHGIFETDSYIGSPTQFVREGGERLRRRLDDVGPNDHGLYHDLVADGMTDYLAMPMPFADGHRNFVSFATSAPGGFTDEDIAKLTTLPIWLGPIFEAIEQRNVAITLLNTYVGSQTGRQILQGLIRRGDGETIRAAIWYSDLRDFTAINEHLPPSAVLAMLNAYFEFVAAAVTARGGEILQFIGDAILVIFRAPDDCDTKTACAAAVDAAVDAFDSLAVLNSRRMRAGEPAIRFGVGLHVGVVTHGNVGSLDRLGFNVVGPAVNRTARLESLTKQVGAPLLLSREVADAIDRPVRGLGAFAMKGVAAPQEVFALVDGPEVPAASDALVPDRK